MNEKNRKICEIWERHKTRNVLINPLTNRKIIKNGPTYKMLEELCLLVDGNSETKRMCKEWNDNRLKNPLTNRRIKENGPVYNSWVRKCLNEDLFKIVSPMRTKKVVSPRTKKVVSPRTKKVANSNMVKKNEYKIKFNNKYYAIPSLIKNWTLEKKIGEGGFGIVFDCYYLNNINLRYAIKIEHKNSSGLFVESNFYRKHKIVSKYFPSVYDIGVCDNLRYIVYEKLYPFKLTVDSLITIINACELLAFNKLSHNDIKFDNFLSRENGDTVLTDFGLYCPVTNKISIYNKGGTPAFMSRFAHMNIISEINDLESLFYNLININIDPLPWEKINKKNKNKILNEIYDSKVELMTNLYNPKIVKKYKIDNAAVLMFGRYISLLKPGDVPNYTFIKNIFCTK